MAGKRGLIMGVANERSIAWGIARVLAGQGAKLAFTYQGDAFGRRAIPLAKSVGSEIIVSCDVIGPEERRQRLRRDQAKLGRPGFRRARAGLLRPPRAVGALRRHHARQFHQHHGDLLLLLHRDRQARRRADEAAGGSLLTLTLRRRHALGSVLQRDGRGQGCARGLGALSGGRPRAAGHPRQRAVRRAHAHAGRRRRLRRAHASSTTSAIMRRCGARRRSTRWAARHSICCPTCRAR